jgi:hypothetical protein
VSLEGGGWEGEVSWIDTRNCTHKRQAHTSDQPHFNIKKCSAMKARLEQHYVKGLLNLWREREAV